MRCTFCFTSWRLLAIVLAASIAGCAPMMGQPPAQEMNMSGTLMRSQTADGSSGAYYLSAMMGMTYAIDVSKVPSPERFVGKQVAVTGTMDTSQGGAAMKIIATKIEAMEGAPMPK